MRASWDFGVQIRGVRAVPLPPSTRIRRRDGSALVTRNATASPNEAPTGRATGKSGDDADDSIVVRDGVDPSTSGFSEPRSTD